MDSKYISIAPSNLFLKVGETKQLQINCDFEDESWSLKVEPEGVVEVDKHTREIKGLKVGYVKITAELHHIKKDGKVIEDKESMIAEVQEGETLATPVKIMLHNRQTNRLVTMVGDLNDEEYVVKLPNTNGTLLTEESVEDIESVIAKPSIINVTHYEPNWKKEFEASEFMVRYGRLNETHVKSQWEFALDKHFNEIIHTVEHETGDLKKCGHELFGLTVWVRVRYVSENYVGKWSDGVTVTLTNDTSADKLRTPLKGGNLEGAYYGNIPHDELVDSYDYRGEYSTLYQYNLKEFKKGQQVLHNSKLWYAKVAMDSNSVQEPGTNYDLWIEDTRENLPTMRLFLDMIGIGVGVADNNVDGYSTGSKQLGELVNKTIGWNKYVYRGRVMYVATLSVCGSICWNDVAKREAAYGNRTIRYGSNYYRVRMLNETEYKVLLHDFAIKDPEYQSLIERQDNELLEDFQEGSKRNVTHFESNEYTITGVDPKSRTCRYRPVLELIAKGSEPFHHPDLGVLADNENFQYDPYTDTGYFGEVPASRFITGDNLASRIGLTAGSSINSNTNWLKFYWHGMVVYIAKTSIRYSVSWSMINNARGHMGFCLGNKDYHTININDVSYRVSNIIGGRKQPYNVDTMDYNSNPTSYLKSNWDQEQARYSMWEELIYRVQSGYVDMGSSDNASWGTSNYKYWHGGPQKGNNWANFRSVEDLILTYGGSRYGNGPICREVSASKDASGNSICVGQLGAGAHNGNHQINYQDTDSGYRPALIVKKSRERV